MKKVDAKNRFFDFIHPVQLFCFATLLGMALFSSFDQRVSPWTKGALIVLNTAYAMCVVRLFLLNVDWKKSLNKQIRSMQCYSDTMLSSMRSGNIVNMSWTAKTLTIRNPKFEITDERLPLECTRCKSAADTEPHLWMDADNYLCSECRDADNLGVDFEKGDIVKYCDHNTFRMSEGVLATVVGVTDYDRKDRFRILTVKVKKRFWVFNYYVTDIISAGRCIKCSMDSKENSASSTRTRRGSTVTPASTEPLKSTIR